MHGKTESELGLSCSPPVLKRKEKTTNPIDVTNIIREYYEELYKFEILLKGEELKVTKKVENMNAPVSYN